MCQNPEAVPAVTSHLPLRRICLDVLVEQRDVLTPDVWLLPAPMVDRVMARLTAVGSRALDLV